jgi:hypothetical protein
MEKFTRRKLITQASVGTGAVGVLSMTAACAPHQSANTSTTSNSSGPSVSVIDDPLAVFVTDPTQGTLKIMKGEREITINNPGLANSLLSLV